jgi:formate C-acetyltransferase
MVIQTPSRAVEPTTREEIIALTPRVQRRKEEYLAAKARISPERSHLLTEYWKASEGEPIALRRAKALRHIMEGISIAIREGELIVGSQTQYVRGSFLYPEFSSHWIIQDLEKAQVSGGDRVEWAISEEDRQTVLEDCLYWKDKSLWERNLALFREAFGSRMDDALEAGIWWQTLDRPHGRTCVNYQKVLERGLKGLIQEAQERLSRQPLVTHQDQRKRFFWQAVIVACEALMALANRYADLAQEMAAQEPNPTRRAELEQIAQICRWVPANPARTFHEALQSFWFCQLGMQIENCATGFSPGRFDQYLYPFYRKDIAEGRLTPSQAAELLGCLWVKFTEIDIFRSVEAREGAQGSMYQNLTIGGVTPDGRDATNELSHLILEVVRQVRLPQPTVSLRYHDGLSDEFLLKAAAVNRDFGGGIPAWFNDKPSIVSLCQLGVPLEEARNWVPIGCVERGIAGGSPITANYGFVNIAKALELALHDGVDPRLGRRVGPATGDPRSFTSYDQLYQAFLKQWAYCLETVILAQNAGYSLHPELGQVPLVSAFLDDCIQKGKDLTEGGGRWNTLVALLPHGYQTAANSLAAIKKLVYEEGSLSMEELLAALGANFQGKEEVRQRLLAAPKYGNDDPYADDIMNDLFRQTLDIADGYTNPWGEKVAVAWMGITIHYYFGKFLGAMPDGRRAGEPTGDGSLSAFRGTDKRGPTAVLNSAARIDALRGLATLLNLKFHPAVLRSADGLRKLLALIKTYFDQYGYHLQFNIVDRATLLEAKAHPEKYRDLIVRVAGFSAYFVELAPEIQDEIIARTEHAV